MPRSSVAITTDPPQPAEPGGPLRPDQGPVRVVVINGGRVLTPAWIADVDDAPAGRELTLIRDPDGVLRVVESGESADLRDLEQRLTAAIDGQQLAELADVQVTDTAESTVLVRDPQTGTFHTRPLSGLEVEPRGSTVWYVDRPPSAVLFEHWRVGDFVAVIAGEERGVIYEITEE